MQRYSEIYSIRLQIYTAGTAIEAMCKNSNVDFGCVLSHHSLSCHLITSANFNFIISVLFTVYSMYHDTDKQ
jgi:hypothetical protein